MIESLIKKCVEFKKHPFNLAKIGMPVLNFEWRLEGYVTKSRLFKPYKLLIGI